MMRFQRGLLLCIAVAIGIATPFSSLAHGGAALHNRDLALVLGGYNKSPLGDIARRISSTHDNEWPTWFRKEIGPVPGNHRVLGHGAPLGTAIPKEFLDAVRAKYGADGVAKVIAKQRELSVRYRDEIMRATGLGKKEAGALLRRFSVSHISGDVTPDNRLVSMVMKFSDQCKVDRDVIERLFRKTNPKYADMVQRKIDAVLRLPKSEQAVAYQKLWAKVKFDDALKQAYGKKMDNAGCKYDINESIRRNELLKNKYASKNPYEKKPKTRNGHDAELSPWRSTFARAGFWAGYVFLRDAVGDGVKEDTWMEMAKVAGREIGLELAGKIVAATIGKRLAENELKKNGSRLLKEKVSELAAKKGAQIVGGAVMGIFGAVEAEEFISQYNEGGISMGEMNAQVAIVAVATGTAVFFTCTEKGAEIGAAIGSVVPGAGNVSGAAIGTVIGVVVGAVGGAASGGVSYYCGLKRAEWRGQKQMHYLEWTRDTNERQWNEEMRRAKEEATQKIERGWEAFGHK